MTIVRKLASLAEAEGFQCVIEPILRQDDITLKPDLILSKNSKTWTLDVAIPWEGNEPLNKRHAEKCRKYANLSVAVERFTGTKEFESEAIVIGARGARCEQNEKTLTKMEFPISDKMKELLCLMTLEGTCQIISWFMRSTESLAFRGCSVRPAGLMGRPMESERTHSRRNKS
ncbi:hypothetical protein M514_27830 [Trichuris suis]|uniref:Uncharacterized protein n=1 Tax=Trichuris suis TaxID=68888 RepID=A0A085MRY6_9BILA|nr:hypothetical protein M514_27830 [Trichuris suis]